MSRTEGTQEAYVKGNKIMLQEDRETGSIDIITASPEDPIQTCTKNAPIRNRGLPTDDTGVRPQATIRTISSQSFKVLSGTSE